MTDSTLLQPDPATIAVSFHPQHRHGDVVSLKFTDGVTGQHYVLVAEPDTTNYLATLFATASSSARIAATADQVRAEQRDRP